VDKLNASNSIRATTIRAIASYGDMAKPAIPVLFQFLNDKNNETRVEASNALEQINPG